MIAEVPELAGCMADGATYTAALDNIEIVVAQWIQTAIELNREIPLPKGKSMYAYSPKNLSRALHHLL